MKKKICIDDSQTERLLTDTYKLAQGREDDICPTVEGMVDEYVPREIRERKKGKKKKEISIEDRIEKNLIGKFSSKIRSKMNEMF